MQESNLSLNKVPRLSSLLCADVLHINSRLQRNHKERKHFWFRPGAFMKRLFILGTSWTRSPIILNIKASNMQPVSPSHFQKGRGSLRIRLSHFIWHLDSWICFVSGCDSSGLTYLTHPDWHWVTGVVKTASVTSNTRRHINQCVSGLNKCRLDIKYNYYHLIKQKCQFTGQ